MSSVSFAFFRVQFSDASSLQRRRWRWRSWSWVNKYTRVSGRLWRSSLVLCVRCSRNVWQVVKWVGRGVLYKWSKGASYSMETFSWNKLHGWKLPCILIWKSRLSPNIPVKRSAASKHFHQERVTCTRRQSDAWPGLMFLINSSYNFSFLADSDFFGHDFYTYKYFTGTQTAVIVLLSDVNLLPTQPVVDL